jgi:hypothetical protein
MDLSDDENDGASVFNVGAYFIDLGQYHVETTATGWVLASDPASKPQSVCITVAVCFVLMEMLYRALVTCLPT